VRPNHLFLGTDADNVADMDAKDRSVRHGVVLKTAQVRRIRRLYAAGRTSQREIGRRFGVSINSVSRIVRGVTWKHIS
jgi:DNA-binding MarR family transcriptional regulator